MFPRCVKVRLATEPLKKNYHAGLLITKTPAFAKATAGQAKGRRHEIKKFATRSPSASSGPRVARDAEFAELDIEVREERVNL